MLTCTHRFPLFSYTGGEKGGKEGRETWDGIGPMLNGEEEEVKRGPFCTQANTCRAAEKYLKKIWALFFGA